MLHRLFKEVCMMLLTMKFPLEAPKVDYFIVLPIFSNLAASSYELN